MTEGTHRTNVATYIAQVLRKSADFLEAIRINNSDSQVVYVLTLYGRIIELTEVIGSLIGIEKDVAVPIVFRTLYEAFVDLILLVMDRDYLQEMYMEHLGHIKRIHDHATKNQNSVFHSRLAKSEEFASAVQHTREEIEKLKLTGTATSSRITKFERIQRIDEYRSIYAMLCNESHNGLSLLESRHLYEDENGIHVEIYASQPLDAITPEIAYMIDILNIIPRNIVSLDGVITKDVTFDEITTACDTFMRYLEDEIPI